MVRGSQFMTELDRLSIEVDMVYRKLVLPGWNSATHGMPDTLYGYMMGTFARIDLLSAYWRGTFNDQSDRMVSFMTEYMATERHANSLAVQFWRHKLMHTSAPRELKDSTSPITYRWLLHWGDEHLPREQHFKLQPGGENLNLSLIGLLQNIKLAASIYFSQVQKIHSLAVNHDVIAAELSSYRFKII
jgi:hypothetical protein